MNGEANVVVKLSLKNQIKTGLEQAKQSVNKTVSEIKDKLNNLKTSHIETFKSMKDEVPGFGRAMSVLGNPYLLMTAGLVALGAAFGKASSIADDFDRRMAKANTTAQESKEKLKITKDEIGAIAAKSTLKDAHTVAPAAYDVMLSSGLDRNTSIKSIPTILKAAKATGTDGETVARATAGVMNSTGIKDSNVVMDKMAMVKNKGNAEFGDIANYLPKIIPAANNAGVALDDVAGSFAYLTSMGLKSEQAATGLENAFKTLADPDKAANFKKIGVDFYDAQGKMRPMLNVIGDLKTALRGLTDQQKSTVLGSLGLDMESASAFSVMTKDVDKLKDSIGSVANATGELDRQAEAAKVPLDSWTQIGNQVHEGWRQLGDIVNSVLAPIGEFVVGIFQSFQDGTNMFSPLLEGIGSIFGGIWDIVTAIGGAIWSIIEPVITWLRNSVIIQDIMWLIGKIGNIIGGIFSVVGDIIGAIGKAIGWVFDNTIKPILDAIEWIYKKVKGLLGFETKDTTVLKVQQDLQGASGIKEAKEKAAPNLYDKPNAKVQGVLDAEKKKEDKKDKRESGMSGGSTTKVININKLSMVDGNWISNNKEFAEMDRAAAERFLTEMFTRAMANLGKSYS